LTTIGYVYVTVQNSTVPNGELVENWNALRHQSHSAVLPGWTSGIGDFAPYMQ